MNFRAFIFIIYYEVISAGKVEGDNQIMELKIE
jgi:hypothetical protein